MPVSVFSVCACVCAPEQLRFIQTQDMKRTFQAGMVLEEEKGMVLEKRCPCDRRTWSGAEPGSVRSSPDKKPGHSPQTGRFRYPMTLHVPRQGKKHQLGRSVACKEPSGNPEGCPAMCTGTRCLPQQSGTNRLMRPRLNPS